MVNLLQTTRKCHICTTLLAFAQKQTLYLKQIYLGSKPGVCHISVQFAWLSKVLEKILILKFVYMRVNVTVNFKFAWFGC